MSGKARNKEGVARTTEPGEKEPLENLQVKGEKKRQKYFLSIIIFVCIVLHIIGFYFTLRLIKIILIILFVFFGLLRG